MILNLFVITVDFTILSYKRELIYVFNIVFIVDWRKQYKIKETGKKVINAHENIKKVIKMDNFYFQKGFVIRDGCSTFDQLMISPFFLMKTSYFECLIKTLKTLFSILL